MITKERATQVWFALSVAATKGQPLTYKEVAMMTGASAQGMGMLLRPIQKYCDSAGLPDLSAIVVNTNSGVPSPEHGNADAVPAEQRQVFDKDWLRTPVPVPEDIEPFLDRKASP